MTTPELLAACPWVSPSFSRSDEAPRLFDGNKSDPYHSRHAYSSQVS